MNMGKKLWYNNNDGENSKYLETKPVPVTPYPPHIPRGLVWVSNLGLRSKRLATNHLSQGRNETINRDK
jgi:hypothetical protein